MAKVAKLKKRETSIHSRAARRQNTPPPDASSKSKQSAADQQNEHWLYNAQNAGVSKKAKAKKLTHAQRVRQSKAVERAERNMDVLQKKVADSKQKERKVQARRQDWEELNGTSVTQGTIPAKHVPSDIEPGVAMNGIEAGFVKNASVGLSEEKQVSQQTTEPPDAALSSSTNGPEGEKSVLTNEEDIIE